MAGIRTSGEDTSTDHLVDIEEDYRHPTDMVSKRRLGLYGSADGFLVGQTGAILGFGHGIRQVAVVDNPNVGR
jgi:hypothetical protein